MNRVARYFLINIGFMTLCILASVLPALKPLIFWITLIIMFLLPAIIVLTYSAISWPKDEDRAGYDKTLFSMFKDTPFKERPVPLFSDIAIDIGTVLILAYAGMSATIVLYVIGNALLHIAQHQRRKFWTDYQEAYVERVQRRVS